MSKSSLKTIIKIYLELKKKIKLIRYTMIKHVKIITMPLLAVRNEIKIF